MKASGTWGVVEAQDYFDIVRYYCGTESQDSTGFEFDLLNRTKTHNFVILMKSQSLPIESP